MTEENRMNGRYPMGQLAQTTEVENYAGFPSGKLKEYLDSAIGSDRKYMLPPIEEHPHAVTGPELMELMRQQSTNFGTRVITDDVVSVDFSSKPLKLTTSENGSFETHTVILATGASANYLGLPSEEKFKNKLHAQNTHKELKIGFSFKVGDLLVKVHAPRTLANKSILLLQVCFVNTQYFSNKHKHDSCRPRTVNKRSQPKTKILITPYFL